MLYAGLKISEGSGTLRATRSIRSPGKCSRPSELSATSKGVLEAAKPWSKLPKVQTRSRSSTKDSMFVLLLEYVLVQVVGISL